MHVWILLKNVQGEFCAWYLSIVLYLYYSIEDVYTSIICVVSTGEKMSRRYQSLNPSHYQILFRPENPQTLASKVPAARVVHY